jgi:hypothetical protein
MMTLGPIERIDCSSYYSLYGHIDAIEKLLSQGANFEVKNNVQYNVS